MDLLYSLGNILILLSLSFRRVILIRVIFAVSDICFLIYGIAIHSNPMVYWAMASLIINFIQISVLIRDMVPQHLSQELQEIKNIFFSGMSTSDFLKLIKLGHRGQTCDQMILEKGKPVKRLMLITEGIVYIDVNGAELQLGAYHFIGEMSYFSDGNASTSIFVRDKVSYLYWEYDDLRRLQTKKPPLFMKMVEAMGKDIVLKMIRKNNSLANSTL